MAGLGWTAIDQQLAPPAPIWRPRIRFGAVVTLAVVAGLTAWIALDRPGEEVPAAAPQADGPRAATADGLSALAAGRGGPVYWAGAREGVVYEVTETSQDYVYVRYLPSGTELGTAEAAFLTVATYPREDAYGDVEAAARRPGAVALELPRGGLAVYDEARPTSIYLAYRGARQQIEIYHPSPREARRIVTSGRVGPVP
jgi:hypothetical protein